VCQDPNLFGMCVCVYITHSHTHTHTQIHIAAYIPVYVLDGFLDVIDNLARRNFVTVLRRPIGLFLNRAALQSLYCRGTPTNLDAILLAPLCMYMYVYM